MAANIMKSGDTIFAGLAECYVTIGDKRYNFMQCTKLTAKFDKQKVEVPILGKTGKGNRSAGWKGTGSATFHYGTRIFREVMEEYKNSGQDIYFDMQISNEDKTSKTGRQTCILKDCNLNSGILAMFDATSGIADEDMDFTFEDFKFPEQFKDLEGFLAN